MSINNNKHHRRESPDSKRKRIDRESFATAISNSINEDREQKRIKNFSSLEELLKKVHLLDTKFWTIIENGDNCVSFCHTVWTPQPKIIMSLSIDSSLATCAYFCDSAMNTLGDFKVPARVNSINDIEDILNKLKECKNRYANKFEIERTLLVLKLVISLLQTITDESFKFINVM